MIYGIVTGPVDFFGMALTAQQLIALASIRDGEWSDNLDNLAEKEFKALMHKHAEALNDFNKSMDWVSPLMISTVPCPSCDGKMLPIFWRKSENNGDVYMVSERKDIFSGYTNMTTEMYESDKF